MDKKIKMMHLQQKTLIPDSSNQTDDSHYSVLIEDPDVLNMEMKLPPSEAVEMLMRARNDYQCEFRCHFERKSEKQLAKTRKARKQLFYASVFCILFMCGEFVGGILASSLALMSDALHLLSDVAGLMISVFALWMTQKEATPKLSFGYHRAEIVGALFSIFLIWGLTIWLVSEAIDRLIHPQRVDGEVMFIVACVGILVNLTMGKILHQGHGHGHNHGHDHSHGHSHSHDDGQCHGHHHDHVNTHHSINLSPPKHDEDSDDHHHHSHSDDHTNINVRSAFIHVLGDLLQSIGVLVAASLIWYDEKTFRIADPICTLVFSVIVIFTTTRLLRDILSVLMESVPDSIDIEAIKLRLSSLPDVADVHDLHVWNLSIGKPALSAHLVAQSTTFGVNGQLVAACMDGILRHSQQILKNEFGIDHSTIQIEWPHSMREVLSPTSCPDYCGQTHNHNQNQNQNKKAMEKSDTNDNDNDNGTPTDNLRNSD